MASTLKEYFDLDLFSVELGWGEGKEDSLVRPKLSLVAWGRGGNPVPETRCLTEHLQACHPENLVSELCHQPYVIHPWQ